jgi:hypothetical protein
LGFNYLDTFSMEGQEEILQLERDICVAFEGRDVSFVERRWKDDFHYVGIRGEDKNKRIIIDEFSTGTLAFSKLEFTEQVTEVKRCNIG